MTSNTFANVTIPCPATPEETLNNKQWDISFREQNNATRNTVDQYHKYDPAKKQIADDEFTGRITFVSLSYGDKNTTARGILEDNKEITLICTGTYSLQRDYAFKGIEYTPNMNFTENFIATISVGHTYK